MSKPLIIYHSPCLDGLTAGWVMWRKFGNDAEYVGLNYGDKFDLAITKQRDVYLVDFCFKEADMRTILDNANLVTVLDHHATAADTLKALEGHQKLRVYYDITKSGAGVAWDTLNPIGPRPSLISMVEFNDTHAPQDVPIETRKVVEFFRALDDPENPFASVERMFRLTSDPFTIPVVDQMGNILVERKRLHVRDLVKNAEVITLTLPDKSRSFKVWATEAPYFLNSETGGALTRHPLPDGTMPAFGVTYTREPGKWRISLRSTDQQEDVRLIAQAFGGGGHRNAAGFEGKGESLPWVV